MQIPNTYPPTIGNEMIIIMNTQSHRVFGKICNNLATPKKRLLLVQCYHIHTHPLHHTFDIGRIVDIGTVNYTQKKLAIYNTI